MSFFFLEGREVEERGAGGKRVLVGLESFLAN